MNEKDVLLKIVKTWKINTTPEYRGFRCAKCQRYIYKAWHYYLDAKGFKTQVHLCNTCKLVVNFKSIYHKFKCDECKNDKRKMYHIWKKNNKKFEEIHLCFACYKKK